MEQEKMTAPVQENLSADTDTALDSFLSREQQPKKRKNKKGRGAGVMVLIAVLIAVAGLTAAIILINNAPYPESTSEEFVTVAAEVVATVNEASEHIAQVPTEADGQPVQNGEGTLIEYTPAELLEVRVERADGQRFALEIAEAEDGTSVYNLVGYENYPLQTGAPDAVANDAASLSFSTIASVGGDPADFGLDAPRATVRVKYTDGTLSRLYIGAEAPAQAGTYLSMGDTDTIYLVADDAVDSFLYTVNDLISCVVTEAADSVDTADLSRLTISGERYPEPIVMQMNTDTAVDYSYQLTSPRAGFADAIESADIAGSIRDLYADAVAGVCAPDQDLDSFLAGFGLTKSYAAITAEYPDTTVSLRCSAPDSDGNVYLVNAGGSYPGERIVYQLQLGVVSWANTSQEKLVADTILKVNKEALTAMTVTADEQTYDITVDTRTQTVDNTDGETEEVTTTEAYCDDKRLDTDGFSILYQNLAALPNTRKAAQTSGSPVFEVTYAYSTGRERDNICVYDSGAVTVNGTLVGATKPSYVKTLIQNIKDLTDGKLPESL